jgi:hypothetical protein
LGAGGDAGGELGDLTLLADGPAGCDDTDDPGHGDREHPPDPTTTAHRQSPMSTPVHGRRTLRTGRLASRSACPAGLTGVDAVNSALGLPTTNTSIALTVSLLPSIIKKQPGLTC